MMMGLQAQIKDDCDGRSREKLRALVLELQDTLSSIERCRKPVLAAIHNGCVGGGVDLISCTDMRYCSADAYFTIKEIDIGMVADVGTLQRLPKLIGNQGIVREMAFTGRKVLADEALRIGLVNQVFETREAMQAGVREMAALIASKSPLSVRGTKEMLNYSRDHSVADGSELHRDLECGDADVQRPDDGDDGQAWPSGRRSSRTDRRCRGGGRPGGTLVARGPHAGPGAAALGAGALGCVGARRCCPNRRGRVPG